MKARAKKRRLSGPSSSFKKRKFRGNQSRKNTKPSQTCDSDIVDSNVVNSPPVSSSKRKLKGSSVKQNELGSEEKPSHYLLISSDVVTELVNMIGCCPECNNRELTFEDDVSNKKGLANCLCFTI